MVHPAEPRPLPFRGGSDPLDRTLRDHRDLLDGDLLHLLQLPFPVQDRGGVRRDPARQTPGDDIPLLPRDPDVVVPADEFRDLLHVGGSAASHFGPRFERCALPLPAFRDHLQRLLDGASVCAAHLHRLRSRLRGGSHLLPDRGSGEPGLRRHPGGSRCGPDDGARQRLPGAPGQRCPDDRQHPLFRRPGPGLPDPETGTAPRSRLLHFPGRLLQCHEGPSFAAAAESVGGRVGRLLPGGYIRLRSLLARDAGDLLHGGCDSG